MFRRKKFIFLALFFEIVRYIEGLCHTLLYYVTLQNGKPNPETSPRVRSWSWSRVLPFPVLFLARSFSFLYRLQPVAVAVSAVAVAVAVYSIMYTYPYVYVCDLILFLSWSCHVCSRLVLSAYVLSCYLL